MSIVTRHPLPTAMIGAALVLIVGFFAFERPQDLVGTHVLGAVIAAGNAPPGSPHSLFVVGVASGDVQRIVLVAASSFRTTLYTRGTTWGQFETSAPPTRNVELLVYGDHGLLEKLTLGDPPGGQRIFD